MGHCFAFLQVCGKDMFEEVEWTTGTSSGKDVWLGGSSFLS